MIMAISETNKPTKEVMKPVKPKGPPLYTFFRPDKQSPTMAATKQRKGRKKKRKREKKFKEIEQMPKTIEAMATPPSSFLSLGVSTG